MKAKRAAIYIIAGVVCACVAMYVAYKWMSRTRPVPAAAEGVEIMLAKRDISYGELLQLDGKDANVFLVSGWPKNLVPAGAITVDKKDRVTGAPMRAGTSFVKYELILEPQIIPEAEFVSSDMYYTPVKVSDEDIASGRFRAGMKVDVLQIVNKEPVVFMRSVLVYAIGKLDQGRPVKEDKPPATVYLLLKKADRIAFIAAEQEHKFMLVEAEDPSIEGPLLVGTTAELREKEARDLFAQATTLMVSKDYENALEKLDEIAQDYGDVTKVTGDAARKAAECREAIAGGLYDQAKLTIDQGKDYKGALLLLDRIENDYPQADKVVQKARDLRKTAQTALDKSRRQTQYQGLLDNLTTCLTQGNLPLARQALTDLEPFKNEGFQPEGDVPAPAKAIDDYSRKIKEAEDSFALDRKVLETHVKQGNLALAREKLRQMKEKYPAHPDMKDVENSVPAADASAG